VTADPRGFSFGQKHPLWATPSAVPIGPVWVKSAGSGLIRRPSGLPSIVLQNSFCTGDQKFCGLQARLSYKDVRDLIASR